MSASKRQTTFAKMKREQAVRERRAQKLEKKRAAAAERRANESGSPHVSSSVGDDETAALELPSQPAPIEEEHTAG
jgi:hypothetical protein